MENTVGNKPLKSRTSHANFRKGLTDYNDGENVTHHLGNDDYSDGANIPESEKFDEQRLSGKTAGGNDFLEDDVADEEAMNERNFDEGIDYE